MEASLCSCTCLTLLLPVIVLVISPARWQLRRLALVPVHPVQPLSKPAVGGCDRPDGVLHLPHFRLAVDCLCLPWPAGDRHGAGLGRKVDRCGLVRPVHPGAGPAVAPLEAGGVLLPGSALLTESQQLLDRLRTGGA